MSDRDDFDPKELTFSEREGIDPLPERLKLGELPQKNQGLCFGMSFIEFLNATDITQNLGENH